MSNVELTTTIAVTHLPRIIENIGTEDQLNVITDNSSINSSPISRNNNQFTFSWSSESSSFTLLTQQDEEAEVAEDDTVVEDEVPAPYFNTYSEVVQELESLIMEKENIDRDDENSEAKYNITSRLKEKVSEIVCRLASLGNLRILKQVVTNSNYQPYLCLDKSDDANGSSNTPLIYASCFGKADVVRFLLQMGAKVDIQDSNGWTPLMWATVNGHSEITKILLEYSASSNTKSASGRTIFDLVDISNEAMISVLNESIPHTSDFAAALLDRKKKTMKRKSSVLESIKHCNDGSQYREITESDDDTASAQFVNRNEDEDDTDTEDSVELKHCEISLTSVHKFRWDQCLPYQMFVFAEEDIEHILNIAISDKIPSLISRAEIYVPVNIIFLSARYAHYYTGRELLHQLLSKAQQRIEEIIQTNADDIHTLSFWISNLFQLLYYLKKDTGLVIATAEYQLSISELISETYTLLITDSQNRLGRILEPTMLEYELIQGLEPIDFADDWRRFFRRGRFSSSSATSLNNAHKIETGNLPSGNCNNSAHACSSPTSILQEQQLPYRTLLTPHTITTLLSSTLYVLSSYEVHSVITDQAIAQLFYSVSCELFNKILYNKKYLNRSKALQIRMNLTVLEDWLRVKDLSPTLNSYLEPAIQLVQLLQCLTQMIDLMTYINTVKTFHQLNPLQLKRLVLNYRYEVNEPRLPEEIEKYAMQIAEDTVRNLQLQKQSQSDCAKRSMESLKSIKSISSGVNKNSHALNDSNQDRKINDYNSSRPSSIASLSSLLYYKPPQRKKSASRATHYDAYSSRPQTHRASIQSLDSSHRCYDRTVDNDATDYDTVSIQSCTSAMDDVVLEEPSNKEMLAERRDSNFLLPFSLPKTTDMVRTTKVNQRASSLSLQPAIDKEEQDKRGKEKDMTCLSDTIYSGLKQKLMAERERVCKEESIVPFIPENWLTLLDQKRQ
ncbi:hypothetical protein BDF20DRAFT_860486 [Mycotypha africana]|uniref:uncharacterized protein n=1 Tax=Mycotypha africana TaxID=64632 RepID=UPI0023016D39|nr:uncharacterized protein BDF20DRAFT_860486 [Mycotypha africana]KAI8984544.1 hypothetical protein BDF20DRAFT_860486 [Mycotypha africana]